MSINWVLCKIEFNVKEEELKYEEEGVNKGLVSRGEKEPDNMRLESTEKNDQ